MNWSSNLVEDVLKNLPLGTNDEDTKFALAMSIIKMKEAMEPKSEVQMNRNHIALSVQRRKMSYLLRVCRIQQLMKESLSPITKHEINCTLKESLEFFKTLLEEPTCKEYGNHSYIEASIQLILYSIEHRVFHAEFMKDTEQWVHRVIELVIKQDGEGLIPFVRSYLKASTDEFYDHKLYLANLVGRLSKFKSVANSIFESSIQYLARVCKDLKEHGIAHSANLNAIQNTFYVFLMIEEAISNANPTLAQSSPNEELVCWIHQFENLFSTDTLWHLPPLIQQYALMLITQIDKSG